MGFDLGTFMISDGIIFDGDDTLWETAPLYIRAKEEFFACITKTLHRVLTYDREAIFSLSRTAEAICESQAIGPNIDFPLALLAYGDNTAPSPHSIFMQYNCHAGS